MDNEARFGWAIATGWGTFIGRFWFNGGINRPWDGYTIAIFRTRREARYYCLNRGRGAFPKAHVVRVSITIHEVR